MSRVDVHHHMLPADYTRWLHEQGITEAGGWQLPEWTATRAAFNLVAADVPPLPGYQVHPGPRRWFRPVRGTPPGTDDRGPGTAASRRRS